jgi:hypothetical protein
MICTITGGDAGTNVVRMVVTAAKNAAAAAA